MVQKRRFGLDSSPMAVAKSARAFVAVVRTEDKTFQGMMGIRSPTIRPKGVVMQERSLPFALVGSDEPYLIDGGARYAAAATLVGNHACGRSSANYRLSSGSLLAPGDGTPAGRRLSVADFATAIPTPFSELPVVARCSRMGRYGRHRRPALSAGKGRCV